MKTILSILLALSAAVTAAGASAQGIVVDNVKENNIGWRASETPDPAEKVERSRDTSGGKSEGGGGGGGGGPPKKM